MKQKIKKRFHCYLHPDCLGTSYSGLCVFVPPEDSSLMGQLIQPPHPGSPCAWLALWSINWLYPLAGKASPLPSPLRISTNPSGIIKGSQRRARLLIFPPCRLRKGERMSWEVSAFLLMDVITSSSKLLGKSRCLSISLHTVQSWKAVIFRLKGLLGRHPNRRSSWKEKQKEGGDKQTHSPMGVSWSKWLGLWVQYIKL